MDVSAGVPGATLAVSALKVSPQDEADLLKKHRNLETDCDALL